MYKFLCRAAFLAVVGLLLLNVSVAQAGGGKNVTGAKIYIQQNKLDDAKRVLWKEINEENPKNEDAWYLLGYIYAREAKYDSMITCFNKALELKPKFREKGVKVSKDTGTKFYAQFGVDMILGIVWTELFNEGVNYFNQALNAPDDSTRLDFFEKAADRFRFSTVVRPDSLMGYRNWAAALMNAGKYEESIPPLEEALKRTPKDPEIRTLLAQLYMVTGSDSLAVPLLEELWQEGNRSEEVAEYLSRAYLKTGEKEKAKALYKEALATNPDNFNFRFQYGTILLQANEYDAAIEQLTEAHRLNPDLPEVNYNLGAAYLNRGVARHDTLPEDSEDLSYKEDFKKARPYLEKAIQLNPDDDLTWTALGQIAGQLNMIALAGYAFSKAENTRSAFDGKVVVGMDSTTLKTIFGEPDQRKKVESEAFADVEEWVYAKRPKRKGKVAVPQQLNVYIKGDRVDALMLLEN